MFHKPAIGAGGSALVFRAEYHGGQVAVKIPRPEGFQGGTATVGLLMDERKMVAKGRAYCHVCTM